MIKFIFHAKLNFELEQNLIFDSSKSKKLIWDKGWVVNNFLNLDSNFGKII